MNAEHTIALWLLALVYMGIIWWKAPKQVSASGFFKGKHADGKDPSLGLLIASAAISWIFAKSIVNAADLSQAFGFWGGVGYGVYYLSFVVAGIAFYLIRTRTAYTSLPAFLRGKYGLVGMRLFLLAVGIRLYNEIWSNTKVVGSFFGPEGGSQYWLAVLVFTVFTVIYTWRGGLRSSLRTDAFQMVFAGLLLAITLFVISPPLIREWPQATPDMTGLAPIILLSFLPTSALNFHLAFWPGLILGGLLAFTPSLFPAWVAVGSGFGSPAVALLN